MPELESVSDSTTRRVPSLDTVVPSSPLLPYDIKDVIDKVVDNADFFELQPAFAKNIVVGLARMAGRTVGIVRLSCAIVFLLSFNYFRVDGG